MKINRTIQATLIGTAALVGILLLSQGTGQPQPEAAQTEMGIFRTLFNMAAWVLENTVGRFR
jgi:hypothetical protein